MMLDALITPISPEDFFRNYWTKSFLHIPGVASKFQQLFPWDVLNRALEEQRFDERRLRLVRSGRNIEAGRYLRQQKVHAAGLVSELASGATLIFNGCEDVHRPLRDLCIYLEALFHHKVITNLYAGWTADNGFDVHWDTQDVLILQVDGRKHWKVWEPTRRFPFRDDVEGTLVAPSGDPVWDGVLEPGGLLSIPRGWWHVAYPLNEPCLHLTVTIRNYNGIDLLHWVAGALKISEGARMELPIIATQEERKAWLMRVREDLLAFWDDELISRFLADQDAMAVSRPNLSLPTEAKSRGAAIERNTLLELAIPRPIYVRCENGRASCQGGNYRWEVDVDVGERLLKFNDRLPHTLAELTPSPDIRFSALVGVLLMKGVIRRIAW
jgi:ribosomal protein L16 Arg81 hydroxylase